MKPVDIIIPVHNRWDHTKQTLDSLIAHTNPDLYTLYVIDDCSEKEVTLKLNEYQQHASVSFELFRNSVNIGPGASRNYVCSVITERETRGKYLYHSDNDVYFRAGWLETLIAVFEGMSKDIKVLGASCHPYLQSKDNMFSQSPYGSVYATTIGIKDAVSGYSQFMTWETWDQFGPFDESMRGREEKIMGSEDWAFCQKVIAAGYSVGSLEPEVVIPCGKTNTYGKPATGAETFKTHPEALVL